MNRKNIKSILTRKINDWVKSVDDEDIKKIIKEKTIITGGAIVSLITNQEINDFDVYFRDNESCKKVAQYYVKKFNERTGESCRVDNLGDRIRVFVKSAGATITEDKELSQEETESFLEGLQEDGEEKPQIGKYAPVWLSTNAITLKDKVQIVVRFYGEPEEIHKNYDFIHCTCYWSSWDNHLELPGKALEAIINKELYYVGSKYPLCSIIRSRKFIERGWHINAGQYLKMCLQLQEIDLKDLNTFEEQLVGVDSAYFSAAIEVIKNKQLNDPEFKIENEYLFEIINRIF